MRVGKKSGAPGFPVSSIDLLFNTGRVLAPRLPQHLGAKTVRWENLRSSWEAVPYRPGMANTCAHSSDRVDFGVDRVFFRWRVRKLGGIFLELQLGDPPLFGSPHHTDIRSWMAVARPRLPPLGTGGCGNHTVAAAGSEETACRRCHPSPLPRGYCNFANPHCPLEFTFQNDLLNYDAGRLKLRLAGKSVCHIVGVAEIPARCVPPSLRHEPS